MKKMKKTLSFKQSLIVTFRGLKLIFKKYPSMFLANLFSIIFTSITPYVIIYFSALIITSLTNNSDRDYVIQLVLLTLSITLLLGVINALLNKWKKAQNEGQPLKLQELLSDKLNDLDYEKIDDAKIHQLVKRIEEDNNSSGWGINQLLDDAQDLISSFSSIIAGLSLTIMLFVSKVPTDSGWITILNNPLVGLFIVLLLFLFSYFSTILSFKASSYWALNSDAHALGNNLFGFYGFLGLDETVSTDVRIYQQNKIASKYFNDKNGLFSSNGYFAKVAKGKMGLLNALSSIVTYLIVFLIYAYICLKAYAGAFGLGEVTQYISSFTKVGVSLVLLMLTMAKMKNNAFFLKQFFDFLDTPNQMYQGSLTVEKRNDNDYEIEFRNVSFKYPNSDNYALKNLNFKFKVGSKIAVVGVNGSGKTTFIKLLCRLYDPTEGEILLNGINIRKYNYREYMNIFSIVFQDFKIFSLKLGENIACKKDYNPEKVIDCLEKVGFSDRLKTLPSGLDTYLFKDNEEDGVSLSGGENQKLAIARSLYKSSSFVILDEPTASLDPIAEEEIYSRFNQIVEDKTTIYISHRLSSCKFCDEILVFDDGKMIQYGTHHQLLNQKEGKYFELWNAQAQYYN